MYGQNIFIYHKWHDDERQKYFNTTTISFFHHLNTLGLRFFSVNTPRTVGDTGTFWCRISCWTRWLLRFFHILRLEWRYGLLNLGPSAYIFFRHVKAKWPQLFMYVTFWKSVNGIWLRRSRAIFWIVELPGTFGVWWTSTPKTRGRNFFALK
jgi:hypothetical protein